MKKIFFILLLLSAASCEKKTDWDLQTNDPGVIVVNGMITNEMKAHRVTIMRPALELNGAELPVSGATVSMTDGNSTWNLHEDDSVKGTYYTDTTVIGLPGKIYTLNISSAGKDYSATDNMVDAGLFSQLKYAKDNNHGLYHISWVANTYNPQNAAMYEIQLDWSSVSGYQDFAPADCRATLYYFTLKTIDVSQIFTPEIEKIHFPAGTKITEKKYSLSPEYENFIRSMLLETQWHGGLFDAIPSNLPTNLSEGAIGYFSSCSVISLSIIVNP
jgi:hypothetical protein